MNTRNPILGGIIAAIFIGFGSWRLYSHYYGNHELETYQIILAVAIIAYGLVVGFKVLKGKNAE